MYRKSGLSMSMATSRRIHLLLRIRVLYIIRQVNVKTCQYAHGKEELVNILTLNLWMKPKEILFFFTLLKVPLANFNHFEKFALTPIQHTLPQLAPTF